MNTPNPTPKVYSQYGAPMGRRGQGYGVEPFGRMYLRRVRLNSGGYDAGGSYWGVGQPLYWYYWENPDVGCEDEVIEDFIRADNREHAIAKLKGKYPNVTFFGGVK